MKKLILKLGLFVIPILIYVGVSVFVDPYNVFHVNNMRFTEMTPDQNFIKTKYILENPDKFNAFLLGSSRVANLPKEGLPSKDSDGEALSWYNMTYAMGTVSENYDTVKTLVEGGVNIREIIVMVDEISMWRNPADDADNLIYKSYQQYAGSPLKFYYAYIKQKPVWRILPQIFQNYGKNEEVQIEKDLFYSYGVAGKNTDMSISGAGPSMGAEASFEYADSSRVMEGVRNLKQLCDDNGIKLVVIATPTYEMTYKEAVANGYLDFLSDLAKETDFYCFSGLNAYTTSTGYYFDPSHFKPYVGLEMEKVVFGSENEREAAENKARCDMSRIDFGVLVGRENVEEILGEMSLELTY